MSDDTADDLRSLLSKSFDDNMASTSLADGVVDLPKPKDDVTADTHVDDDKAGDGRIRGADGKFVKKDDGAADSKTKDVKAKTEPKTADKTEPDAKTADKSEPKATDKTDDKTVEPDKTTEAKPGDPKEPPARWSASDKAMFKLQPPEVQDFLLRRHAAMEADYTKRTTEIAEFKREFEPIQKLFAPYTETLKAKGLTPASVIQRWADVETRLANGQGADIVAGLVKGYNIDKAKVAAALGLGGEQAAPIGAANQQTGQTGLQDLPPAVAAELAQLRQAVNSIQTAHQSAEQQAIERQRQAAAQREAEVESKISSFKTATAENGELLHPFYDEVEQDMVRLALSYQASGQPIPELPQLYETAVYANPSTRQALLATQQAAQAAKATEEARAKAASARRAASSITGAPGSGQATRTVRSDLSLRESLEEAAAELE